MSSPVVPIETGVRSRPLRPGRARALLLSILVFGLLGSACGGRDEPTASPSRFEGTWTLVAERSTAIDPWNDLSIAIDVSGSTLTLKRTWAGNYGFAAVDSTTIPIDGTPHRVSLAQWPDNRHIGAFVAADSTKQVSARWLDDGRTLQVTTRLTVRASQGPTRLRTHSEYRVGPDGDDLTVLELRSTRPQPIRYTFERASSS